MEQYRVVVTHQPGNGSDPKSRPQMILRVEVENGRAHITELNMRAPTGAAITSAALPPVNLELLAQAFGADEAAAQLSPAPEPAAAEPSATPGRKAESPARLEPARPVRSGRRRASPSAADAPPPSLARARAYRKMPDPAELQRVYQEVGSIVGVAKHYDVPTHTAQGWIGRLRKRGGVPTEG